MKYRDLVNLIKDSNHVSYPVVNNEMDMIFLGCVARQQLKAHLFKYFEIHDALHKLMQEVPDEFDELKDEWEHSATVSTREQVGRRKHLVADQLRKQKLAEQRQRRGSIGNARQPRSARRRGSMTDIKNKMRKVAAMVSLGAPGGIKEVIDLSSIAKDASAAYFQTIQHIFDIETAPEITLDPSAFTIPELMGAEQIHILFEMLRCKRVFVTSFGTLIGVISPSIFSTAVRLRNSKSKKDV